MNTPDERRRKLEREKDERAIRRLLVWAIVALALWGGWKMYTAVHGSPKVIIISP